MHLISHATTVVLLVFTFLPLIQKSKWWIRIFDFPRLQVCILLVINLLFTWLWSREIDVLTFLALALQVVAIVFLLSRILPYTPFAKKQVNDAVQGEEFSLLYFNVEQKNREYGLTLKLIEDFNPDIFLLIETDTKWMEEISCIKNQYPYSVEVPQENTYGLLLYSKFALKNQQVHFLVEQDIPSIYTQIELPSGKLINSWFIHPRPPHPKNNTHKRDREILLVGKKLKEMNLPVIVAGDLNDVAWSYTTSLFQKTSKLLDPRMGRGFYNTFHAKIPFVRWPLDHIFHSRDFTVRHLQLGGKANSDHFPVYIQLCLEIADNNNEVPSATKEDDKKADDKINEKD